MSASCSTLVAMPNLAIFDQEIVAQLSPSAKRLLRRPRPRLRGVLHKWAAILAIPAGVVLTVGASGYRASVSMAVFAVGAIAMLGVSAIVHSRDWPPEKVEMLVRLDHSAIFVMYATTATPVALLGLDGRVSTWMMSVVWTAAAAGVIAEWLPVHPPAGVVNAIYLSLGWSMLVFVPWMLKNLTVGQLVLLFIGGGAYTIGAVVVGSRRPDPWTDIFGYHEIWHVFVVLAVLMHGWMAYSLGW